MVKSQLNDDLRAVTYDDSRNLVENISEGYNETRPQGVYLKTEQDIDYVLGLIGQSYKDIL